MPNSRLSHPKSVGNDNSESHMTSAQKIKANRANAQASTGPRTAQGKARTARNARRHGLSLSVISDPVLSEQVEALARKIAGQAVDAEIYQRARRIAEAQIDLQRVRYARPADDLTASAKHPHLRMPTVNLRRRVARNTL